MPALPDLVRVRPFQPTTDPHALWPGPAYRDALATLLAGVRAGAEVLVLTGDVGTGKTILASALAERLRAEGAVVGRVDYPNAEPSEFLQSVAAALGLGETVEPWAVFGQVGRLVVTAAAGGRPVLLVVEEAQSLAPDLLAEVGRLASAERPGGFSILLVGGEALEANLAAASHAALAERVAVRCRLRPLEAGEVRDYVEHRLGLAGLGRDTFTPLALRLVGEASGGVPRLVNTLCDHALSEATRRGLPVVDSELVQACIEEMGPPAPRARRKSAAPVPAAAAAPAAGHPGDVQRSWTLAIVALALGVGLLGLVAGYLVRGPRPDVAGPVPVAPVATPPQAAPAAATIAIPNAPARPDAPPPAEVTASPAAGGAPGRSPSRPEGKAPSVPSAPAAGSGAGEARPREASRPPEAVRPPETPKGSGTASGRPGVPPPAAEGAPAVVERTDRGPDPTSIIDWLLRESPRRVD